MTVEPDDLTEQRHTPVFIAEHVTNSRFEVLGSGGNIQIYVGYRALVPMLKGMVPKGEWTVVDCPKLGLKGFYREQKRDSTN